MTTNIELGVARSARMISHTLRLFKFGLVGLSGLVVNSAVLYVAVGVFGIHYLIGATIATQASTVWNFMLSDRWVFSDKTEGRARWERFWMFWLMNNLALIGRWPVLFLFISVMGLNYLISNLISLVVVMLGRYAFSYAVIWRTRDTVGEFSA